MNHVASSSPLPAATQSPVPGAETSAVTVLLTYDQIALMDEIAAAIRRNKVQSLAGRLCSGRLPLRYFLITKTGSTAQQRLICRSKLNADFGPASVLENRASQRLHTGASGR